MKFRKKPVVIEAVQYDGKNVSNIITFVGYGLTYSDDRVAGVRQLKIPTLEGDHWANPGDWIIRGVKGEHYPIKPDIFEATYEAVVE